LMILKTLQAMGPLHPKNGSYLLVSASRP
jgi:hypothetical protein